MAFGDNESSPPSDSALDIRSLVSAGDGMRLQHLCARARRGEPLTVGVIGGSITQGAAATKPEFRYGDRVASWWREHFPGAQVQFVNAGIGATGSDYGALRARRDLLSHQPDFVIIEYAVNDANTRAAAETLEGLLRQILEQKNQPAVMLLFMMNQQGQNAQEWFTQVGAHYHLPMVSYRDALWPEIEAHRMPWSDISPDAVHPNDRGHAYAARFVTSLLESQLTNPPSKEGLAGLPLMPQPWSSDLYEQTSLMEADALKPTSNKGWSYDAKDRCWTSDQPGSIIEFEVIGKAILTMHYVVRGPMGRARVTVDGGMPQDLEGWFDQTWGGYRQTKEIARQLNEGQHRVRFELLDEKQPQSNGHEFRILGLGTAGIAGPRTKSESNADR
jgi:lysophospholipase L1-like esterase